MCGKPLCADCFTSLDRGIVCEDPDHRRVLENWSVIVRSNSEFEADMILRNLEYEGIETRMFSSRAFKLTIGEDPRDFAQVFVHESKLSTALAVLRDLNLPSTAVRDQNSNKEGLNVV